MTYVRASDGARIHYRVTGRPGAPPILFIQGLGADKHGWDLQRLATAPWYQAVALDNRGAGRSDKPRRRVQPRADGRRCDRRARPCRRRHGARRGSVDGWGDQPDHRREVPRADPFADARLHGRPQPSVARGAPGELGATPRSNAACRSMSQEAARWVIGPRSFRRLMPLIGWFGPLGLGRPAHAFVAQCDAILNAAEQHEELVDAAARHRRADARDGRQPGHPHAAWRQRGARRAHPDRRAGRHQRAAHGFMVEHATTFNRVLLEFLGRAEKAYQRRIVAEPKPLHLTIVAAASG